MPFRRAESAQPAIDLYACTACGASQGQRCLSGKVNKGRGGPSQEMTGFVHDERWDTYLQREGAADPEITGREMFIRDLRLMGDAAAGDLKWDNQRPEVQERYERRAADERAQALEQDDGA